jgi:protein-S-isoprenylcysteine O-methyltransferase Ste14
MIAEAELYGWLVVALIALAPVTFVALLGLNAPYGRHTRRGWGPTMSTRWMWVVMESPASVGFVLLYFAGIRALALVPLVLLGLWQLHYVHRTFIYPLRIRPARRTPVVVALLGMLFQLLNSYVNARHISEFGLYRSDWLTDPRFLVGVALFLVGMYVNQTSDHALISLREESSGYQIPRGGLFRYVSCPNYFGEMVEWCGWAVLTWSASGLGFALYTIANLLPRALSHHRWYREQFPDYPATRRAVLPFVL